jgi:hypothetical protein
MEMNGAKKLVIWYDENVRVTLERNKKGESWGEEETSYPKSPGEVYFKDNVLVASKDERRVSLGEEQNIRRGRILRILFVDLHGA